MYCTVVAILTSMAIWVALPVIRNRTGSIVHYLTKGAESEWLSIV
jgi:hypothetical protein